MKFRLVIDCANDSFGEYPGTEVARILRELADEVEADGMKGGLQDWQPLRDINGNYVGTAATTR